MMEKESVADFGQRVLEALKPEDFTEEDQKMESSQIWKHTMEPNEVMVIPAGCFTMEQTVALSAEKELSKQQIADSFVIGLRTHYLEGKGSDSVSWLQAMKDAHETSQSASDDVCRFWNAILDATNNKKSNKDKDKDAAGSQPSKKPE